MASNCDAALRHLLIHPAACRRLVVGTVRGKVMKRQVLRNWCDDGAATTSPGLVSSHC